MKRIITPHEITTQKGNHGQVWISCRRYTIGKFPLYDQKLQAYKSASNILTESKSVFAENTFDKKGLQSILYYLKGKDERGLYFDGNKGQLLPSKKRLIDDKINELERQWLDHQQTRVNQGFDKPTKLPPNLDNLRLEIEAELDNFTAEVTKVEHMLNHLQETDDSVRAGRVLYYGPQQAAQLKNGVICEMDGQRVSQENGVLIIDDSASPYDGMRLSDYRSMAKSWREKRIKVWSDLVAQRNEEIAKTGSSAMKPPPFPSGTIQCRKEDLPAWPEGVQSFKKSKLKK